MGPEMRCYNCKKKMDPPEVVNVGCNEPGCLWGILICKHCYETKIGDGSQHAVIAARAHAAEHAPFMLVRLNAESDTRGQLVGHVRDDDELKRLIKLDLKNHGPADYLVHNTRSKTNVRVNVKSAPQVFDGKKGEHAQTETESPVEATSTKNPGSTGNGETPPEDGLH
jgi:hypothetical protein